jgi:hypothetical protein
MILSFWSGNAGCGILGIHPELAANREATQ